MPAGACEVKGCTRQAVTTFTDRGRKAPETRNVCRPCLEQLERWAAGRLQDECRTDGCNNKATVRGLCRKCYDHAKNSGKLDEKALPSKPHFARKTRPKAEPTRGRTRAKKKATQPRMPAKPSKPAPTEVTVVAHAKALDDFVGRCQGVVIGAEDARRSLGVLLDERRFVRELLARLAVLGRDANNLLDVFERNES